MKQNLNIRARNNLVDFCFCWFDERGRPKEVRPIMQVSWNIADEIYMAMKRAELDVPFPGIGLRISRELSNWTFLLDGKEVIRLPLSMEEGFRKTLAGAARRAEAYEKANRQIAQDALAIRSGAPFSLSSHPKMREEAIKDAQWDPKARKGMPMNPIRYASAQSCKTVGRPAVKGGKNVSHLN